MPSPSSREGSSSTPLPNPYLGGAGVDYGDMSFYPRSPSPSRARHKLRASVLSRSPRLSSPSPSILPSEGGSIISAAGESTQLQLAKIIQLLASKDVSMLRLTDRQRSMAHRVEETSTALDGVIERLSAKMEMIPELSEQLALQNTHHETLAKNVETKLERFGTALNDTNTATSTIAELLDGGLRTLSGRMDAMEVAHGSMLSKVDQLLRAINDLRKHDAEIAARPSHAAQSRLPTPTESPSLGPPASPAPESFNRRSPANSSQTEEDGASRPHKRRRASEQVPATSSDRPSQSGDARTQQSISQTSNLDLALSSPDHDMSEIQGEEQNGVADMGQTALEDQVPADTSDPVGFDLSGDLLLDDRGLDDVEALLRSDSPSSTRYDATAGAEYASGDGSDGGQGEAREEQLDARDRTASRDETATSDAERPKVQTDREPGQIQRPTTTPSGRRHLRATQSTIDYHSHPLDGVFHRGDIKKPGSAKAKRELPPGRSRTFYGKVWVNDRCLAPSDGMKRGYGVWPRKGEFTVKGKVQEIICDCCKGRVHWACAGFQDKDEIDPDSPWDCPDCQAAIARGAERELIAAAPQDRCVRYNCVCREKKATIRQPRDEDLYVIERIVGRRAVARRPDKSRVFEYLVKWAGWPVEDSTWEKDDQFPRTNQFVKDFIEAATAERVELRPAVSILAEARPYLDDKGNFKAGSEESSSPAPVPAERVETTQPQTQGSAAATSVSAPTTSSTS